MTETIERVPVFHFPGVKARTLRDKAKLKRVYNCPKCNKKFVVALTLREVCRIPLRCGETTFLVG